MTAVAALLRMTTAAGSWGADVRLGALDLRLVFGLHSLENGLCMMLPKLLFYSKAPESYKGHLTPRSLIET